MSTVTHDQVMQRIEGLGVPLENVFLIAEDNETHGVIAVWYPEIGLRSIIIEKDDLYTACYNFLRESGVRRFKSWDELGEAQQHERWEGWDTCADWRRFQQAAEELNKSGSR
jgi:hypothetical protein